MSEEMKLFYAGILVAEAMIRHGMNIRPVSVYPRFRDGLTVNHGNVILWYNDDKNGTFIVKTPLEIK